MKRHTRTHTHTHTETNDNGANQTARDTNPLNTRASQSKRQGTTKIRKASNADVPVNLHCSAPVEMLVSNVARITPR